MNQDETAEYASTAAGYADESGWHCFLMKEAAGKGAMEVAGDEELECLMSQVVAAESTTGEYEWEFHSSLMS